MAQIGTALKTARGEQSLHAIVATTTLLLSVDDACEK
jgi:hypothetical protein